MPTGSITTQQYNRHGPLLQYRCFVNVKKLKVVSCLQFGDLGWII